MSSNFIATLPRPSLRNCGASGDRRWPAKSIRVAGLEAIAEVGSVNKRLNRVHAFVEPTEGLEGFSFDTFHELLEFEELQQERAALRRPFYSFDTRQVVSVSARLVVLHHFAIFFASVTRPEVHRVGLARSLLKCENSLLRIRWRPRAASDHRVAERGHEAIDSAHDVIATPAGVQLPMRRRRDCGARAITRAPARETLPQGIPRSRVVPSQTVPIFPTSPFRWRQVEVHRPQRFQVPRVRVP